jgi:hypothetical protein
MILLHETVQIIHEPLSSIFGVLEVDPHVDGLHRTDLLAHPAEDAPELVDLINDGIPVALIILPTHEPDAVRGANRGAKPAGHTLGSAVGVNLHPVGASPTRGEVGPFFRVLERDLIRVYKMLEGQGHTFKCGT